ncbi:nuclear transport factor 2 family protein (plasmid) [Paenibacillus rhizovicinus]|uniref:Nuclear transport factor 2 family protein n=1 Tax=Paenibacillus rhizovicinus TaxID=2704463 RepID=A0A6C0PB59_9BACL|nr:nuclear transport factor 2 family protein [Paenibacillus rhizovicinus]QHW34833.1 nuclear transport factor 2 family protein [Paenibacillus rhizovicinus]QHW35595.1 nuclear transport factor 2 family protein [Paenibacillus rhizovicinus]
MTHTNEQESQSRLYDRIVELEHVRALRELVDTFSILADQKDTQKQTTLFTADATVDSIVDGNVVSSLRGTDEIGTAFESFLKNFDIVYHFNGQHNVSISGNTAKGTLYCLVDLIATVDGKKINNKSGVHYEDEYVFEDGHWLIAKRTSTFAWQDRQEINT